MRHGFPLFVFFLLIVSVCFSFYDPTLPSDTGVIAEGPAQIRENFRALKEDQIVDAGTLQGVELLDIMRADGTNADSPVFPGPVTVNGVLTASDSAVIGTSTAQAGYDLTVASGAYLANVVATGTLTIPLVAPADPQTGMIWFEP
jgi:hypothetical protein